MKSVFTRIMLGALLAGSSLAATAQTRRNCASYDYLLQQMTQDPNMIVRRQAIEDFTQLQEAHPTANKGANTRYNIPVVVHVLYNTAAQNISDAQIQSQIDALNRDYQLLNTDTASIPAVYASLKADCQIQFCLAQRDPSGNATTGILRKSTSRTSFSADNDNAKNNATGGDNAWPRDQYLNLWVVPAITNGPQTGILGYAQFPGGPAATDGVVIGYKYFGTTGTAAAPFNKGRTAVHEIGHWLNLNHIWGDDGAACSGSDNVGDTPNQGAENYDCPSFPHISCSNGPGGDMFMNYMDYTNDGCMYLFTAGQKARMHAVLMPGGARAAITQSQGCIPPSAMVCGSPAGLSSDNVSSNTADLSWIANTAATSYNLQWKAAAATTWNTVSGITGASYSLTGLASNTAYSFQVQSICPSGTSVYSAEATFTTLSAGCVDNYEPNEIRTAGALIPVNTAISAKIGTAVDKDYFKFMNTTAAPKIKITLSNLPADYDVKLFNSNGTLLGTSQNSGTLSENLIYNTSTAGTYYVYVYGYNGANSNGQCYSLLVQTSNGNFRENSNVTEAAKNDMALFPNPAAEDVYFEYYSAATGSARISIIDASGRVVRAVDAP